MASRVKSDILLMKGVVQDVAHLALGEVAPGRQAERRLGLGRGWPVVSSWSC